MTSLKLGDFVVNLSEIILGKYSGYGGQFVQVFKAYRNGQDVSNFCAYIINQQYIINQMISNPLQLMANQDLSFNILQLYYSQSYENNQVYIGESCDFCLENYLIQRAQFQLSSQEIFDILGQIVNGYTYLAKCKIKVNLNLEMIYIKKLMDNQILVKLFDYIYQYKSSNNDNTIRENLLFSAPETLQWGTNDQRSDIFLLGIILFQLCYQKYPFQVKIQTKENILNYQKSILQNNTLIQLPNNTNIDRELQNLIKKMLVYDPDDRIKWQTLQDNPKLQLKFIVLKNRYYINFEKQLGSGAQGITFLSIDLETQIYCGAKRISNKQQESQREIEIYQTLLSKSMMCLNIIQIKDIIRYNDQYTFIIMEKCDENLEDYYIKNKDSLNDSDIVEFLYQVTLGYIFLKNMNIIHRDLKPQNILVRYQNQKPLFKIIDLGVGKILTSQQLATSVAGTPLFCAPEVLNEIGSYNHQCDIFSLGAVLYYMVYHKPHVNVSTLEELKAFFDRLKYNDGEIKYSSENGQGKKVNKDIHSLMQQMLLYNPNKRITWEQLKLKLENIKSQLPITTKIRVIAQSQGQTQIPSQPTQLSIQEQGYQNNQNNIIDLRQQQQIFPQSNQSMDGKQQKIKILSQVKYNPSLYYQSETPINQDKTAQYLIAQQAQQSMQQQKALELQNSNRNYAQNQITPQNIQVSIQNQIASNETVQINSKNMTQNAGQSKDQNNMNYKQINDFANSLKTLINKELENIEIIDIISSLIIISWKANKLIKAQFSKQIDQKESIVLYSLITIFIDICLDNLQVLKEKKYLLIDDQEQEVANSFLDNLKPQSIIFMKRELKSTSNELFNKAKKKGEYIEIKEYVQKIRNYHEMLSRKRHVSFLEGLTYFFEYYSDCQAKGSQFHSSIQPILEQLYVIHTKTDFNSLREYIFDCKVWEVQF